MPRPRKRIPQKLEKEIEETMDSLNLAEQLMPLMFDLDNMSILLALKRAHGTSGLPFVSVGEVTGLGKSQKLVDRLNLMISYGLVERTNGKYDLTEFGLSAASFAERLVVMINEDQEIARRSKLTGHLATVNSIRQKSEELVRKRIREGT